MVQVQARNTLLSILLLLTVATDSMAQSVDAGRFDTQESCVSANDSSRSMSAGCYSWLALRTNLLYDAAVLPNVGVEIAMGRRWTAAVDWFYTWFSSDKRHRYWQSYGGYLTLRKYLGGAFSAESTNFSQQFTGHHVGIYGCMLTYDVEWGGRGYQADTFGFGAGIEYGYSKRIGRRLCLDLNLGLGFQDGEYKEYLPTDDGTGHYVWQATLKRHWWGPTKAEVSLKWLLGPTAKKKGGAR